MNPEKEDKERRTITNIGTVLKKLTNLRVGNLTVFVDKYYSPLTK